MKLLLDMNLAPALSDVLQSSGLEAIHWSAVGEASASDASVMEWALANGYIVLTHDLDSAAVWAATSAGGPSVVQIRTQDVLSKSFQEILLTTLGRFRDELEGGAVVSVDATSARARILPLTR